MFFFFFVFFVCLFVCFLSIHRNNLISNQLTRWYFANGSWMPTVTLIAIWALHKDARIGETLRKDLATDIIESHAFTDMPSGLFHHGITINVRKQTETKAFGITWIRETIHCDTWLWGMKRLPNSCVQLVITYRTPKFKINIE